MGFLSLDCPFFQFFYIFLFFLDLRVLFYQILFLLKIFSVLYIRDSDFTNVQTKIEAKNMDFLSLMGFLSLNCPFS